MGALLGTLWALPTTLVGLAVFYATGAEFVRLEGAVIILAAKRFGPLWRFFLARGIGAMTLGSVSCFAEPTSAGGQTLAHELRHVWQGRILGPLFLPFYGLCSLVSWATGKGWYTGNALEADARAHEVSVVKQA